MVYYSRLWYCFKFKYIYQQWRAVTKYRSILSLEFEQIKFSILLYDEMWGAINNLNFVAAAQNIAGNIAGQVNEQIAICLLFTFKRLAAAVRLVQ